MNFISWMSTCKVEEMTVEPLLLPMQQPSCLGKLPGKFVFDQTVVRQHLLKCLKMQRFTMFPVHSECRQGGRIGSKQTIKLYCQCRMPDVVGEPMIRCNKCKECFHGKIHAAVPQKSWKTTCHGFAQTVFKVFTTSYSRCL